VTTHFSIEIGRPAGDGWVQLPVESPKSSGLFSALRGQDRDLGRWSASLAGQRLGPGADRQRLDAYARMLTGLAAGGRKRGLQLGYAWLPDGADSPAANVDVSVVRTSRERPVLTLESLEEQFASRDAGTERLDVSRAELPAGPAVRLLRQWRGSGSPAARVVSVTYVTRPPEIRNAVVYSMFWAPADADADAGDGNGADAELTEYADRLAATLRILTAP